MTIAQQRSPWDPYYTDSLAKGKGKGPPTTSNAPEPATYGALFVGLCLVVIVVRQWGIGAKHQHTRRNHKNAGNRRDQMRWSADGRCAIRILEQIEPYMICKAKQSQVVRRFYERYLVNHPYEISEDEERDIGDMIAEIHRLNRRGIS